MTTLTRIRSDLDQAIVAVGAAQTLLDQGQVIDLSGLETHVETFCGDIGSLSAKDRMTLNSSLVALIDDLNKLENDIETRNVAVGEELGQTSVRKRAAMAYSSGNPKGDEH